eukprot:gene45028-19226_t
MSLTLAAVVDDSFCDTATGQNILFEFHGITEVGILWPFSAYPFEFEKRLIDAAVIDAVQAEEEMRHALSLHERLQQGQPEIAEQPHEAPIGERVGGRA